MHDGLRVAIDVRCRSTPRDLSHTVTENACWTPDGKLKLGITLWLGGGNSTKTGDVMTDGEGKEAAGVATYFASPDRATDAELQETLAQIGGDRLLDAIQQSIDGHLMVLNAQRQILAVNLQLLETFGIETPDCLVGQRPGEALGCIHAPDAPVDCIIRATLSQTLTYFAQLLIDATRSRCETTPSR